MSKTKKYGATIKLIEGSHVDCNGFSGRCFRLTFHHLNGTLCNGCENPKNDSCSGVTKGEAIVKLVPSMGDKEKALRDFTASSNCNPELEN